MNKKLWGLFIVFISLILIICGYINIKRAKSKNSWVGAYNYAEFAPPNITISYWITIYEEDGLYAKIKIDGFQTLRRLKAKVRTHGNEISFEFYDFYVDNRGHSNQGICDYKKGDILLTLVKQDNTYVIEWGALSPTLEQDLTLGQYFEKVSDDPLYVDKLYP